VAPYLFKTTDYGMSWQPLRGNLPPEGPVHVVREDARNKELLYVGTEFGLFLSLDGGTTWHRQTHGLPTVAVHDVAVQPRERELAIATHGRGIYIMDVAPLQELTPEVLAADVHLFEVKPAVAYRPRNKLSWAGTKTYQGANPPYGAGVYYYLKEPLAAAPKLTITDAKGNKVIELKTSKDAGLHRAAWLLSAGGAKTPAVFRTVPAGEYQVTLRVGERTWRKPVKVEAE
jgi:hypothetical protein